MLFKNFFRLLKTNVLQILATVFLLSFLIFFLNILIALTANIYSFSQDIKWKLGVYLYFNEWEKPDEINKNYAKIIQMQDRLRQAGLKVKFYSKEDAIKTLSKRLPKIIQNFEKYGIKNPLPPTMYITFSSEAEYQKMKQIVTDPQYSDIILNLSDVWGASSFKSQEQRVSKIIEFSNFLIKFYVFLSVVLVFIILWFIILIIKINFYNFYNQIEVEKLLWFSYLQIKFPFLMYALFVILFSFVLSLVYLFVLVNYLNVYFVNVFDFNLFKLISENLTYIKYGLIGEILFLVLISLGVSNLFLTRLIKKI